MTVPGDGDAAAALRGAEHIDHPHINNDNVMENVNAITDARGFDRAADAALFQHLQARGVINQDGEIDFTKLGLSPRQIKRAGLEGKVFIKNNGQLDFNIRGKCGDNAVKALEGFKQAIDGFIKTQTQNNSDLGSKITLSVNPSSVATPSAADLDVLRRGGQIQYRPGDTYTENVGGQDVELQNTVKLTLDPGEKGHGDGLTIQVLNESGQEVGNAGPIPLDVVFEGQEHGGHKALKNGQPILPQWRDRKLFEGAHIHVEQPGLGAPESNVNDPKRIQAENNLWSGVMDYLRATSKVTVGAFDAGGGAAAPGVADAGAAAAAGIGRDAQLNTLYADLNAYLATPKAVTTDGLDQFIRRLNDLKPEAGKPESNLLNYLNQLQQAINNPAVNALPKVLKGIPPVLSESLSHIWNGLAGLQRVMNTDVSLEVKYQVIKNDNENAATPIGQYCPMAAVNVALTGLRQEAVNAMMGEINGAPNAADLAQVDQIDGFGNRLAQVDLAKGSAESNRVGQALLDKLTANPGGPWRTMAASGNADRIAELQRQVAAFEHHFPNAVPDVIKNARAAAPPPPPPGAGDPARGGGLANNNWRELRALHLYGAVASDPIPKATAKAQLEAMLQAYRDICAYANSPEGQRAKCNTQHARAVLVENLNHELTNVDGLGVNALTRTRDLEEMKRATTTPDPAPPGYPPGPYISDAQCEAILQKYIDACA
jgi:hypothetical protein